MMGGWGALYLDGAAGKALMLRRVQEWWQAVDLQHTRLCQQDSQERSDLYLYVLAVYSLHKAVWVLKDHYKSYRKDPTYAAPYRKLLDAWNRFQQVAPNVNDLRDMLVHFEAYDRRIGHLQKPPATAPTVPSIRMGEAESYWYKPMEPGLVLFGKRLMVAATTQAAKVLADTADENGKLLPEWSDNIHVEKP